MIDSNTLANIAAIKQLKRVILKNIKSQCMKASNTLAKQLQTEVLKNTKSLCIMEYGVKYSCKVCRYQTTTNKSLKKHKRFFRTVTIPGMVTIKYQPFLPPVNLALKNSYRTRIWLLDFITQAEHYRPQSC